MLRRTRHRFGLLHILTAAIALVSQLAIGAMVLPDSDTATAAVAALDAVSMFCDGNSAPRHDDPASHSHRPGDPALCPISVALALPSVILTPAPELPVIASSVLFSRTSARPPGRGPPAATARVGAPRAPPLTA